MELKEKLNGGRRLFFCLFSLFFSKVYLAHGVLLSCRTTVGGFHSDSVFGVDTQISRDVNCLSVGLLDQNLFVVTVLNKGFFFFAL